MANFEGLSVAKFTGGVNKVNLNNAGGKEQAAIGQLIAAMDGATVCVQS